MKTIIAGSRTITDFDLVRAAIKKSGFNITEVVSGGCKGPDLLGERWAKQNHIPIKRFNANWQKHGNAAGPIRNIEMSCYALALIAVWDGKSKGTKLMIDLAERHNLRVKIHFFNFY